MTTVCESPEVHVDPTIERERVEQLAQAVGSGHPPDTIELESSFIRSECIQILAQYGVPVQIASTVMEDLLSAETEGYPTHGLLRFVEYASSIKNGAVYPDKEPLVTFSTGVSKLIDGQKSFGVLAARRAAAELQDLLTNNPVAVVGLTNSNHLGRLAHIGQPLAKKGFIVIGFVNYFGPGRQKVAPWKGATGRLCTNPVLVAIPTDSGEPIVVDISTSTVAEGKVRLALYNGQPVPDGWLVNHNWVPVNDPSQLYSNNAFLTPLGGDQGHKGFALGLVVDILAGIITGAGFSRENPSEEGSGGLFLGLNPSILGRSFNDVAAEIRQLAEYCSSCPTPESALPVRIPGQRSQITQDEGGTFKVSESTWKAIQALRKG